MIYPGSRLFISFFYSLSPCLSPSLSGSSGASRARVPSALKLNGIPQVLPCEGEGERENFCRRRSLKKLYAVRHAVLSGRRTSVYSKYEFRQPYTCGAHDYTYVCTYTFGYCVYLLLRFYDNCREENRKTADGERWRRGEEKFERLFTTSRDPRSLTSRKISFHAFY